MNILLYLFICDMEGTEVQQDKKPNMLENMGQLILEHPCLGLKKGTDFYEQYIIRAASPYSSKSSFKVDFYLPEYNIVIQLDSEYRHLPLDRFVSDRRVDKSLKWDGYKVLRYWFNDVMFYPENIIQKIKRELDKLKDNKFDKFIHIHGDYQVENLKRKIWIAKEILMYLGKHPGGIFAYFGDICNKVEEIFGIDHLIIEHVTETLVDAGLIQQKIDDNFDGEYYYYVAGYLPVQRTFTKRQAIKQVQHVKRMLQSIPRLCNKLEVKIHKSGYSGTIKFYREIDNNIIDQIRYLGAHVGDIKYIPEDKVFVTDFYFENDKHPNSLTNNTQWMQGYRDGSIYNVKHTPQFNTGFSAACHDKKAVLLKFNQDDLSTCNTM